VGEVIISVLTVSVIGTKAPYGRNRAGEIVDDIAQRREQSRVGKRETATASSTGGANDGLSSGEGIR
jgi:hypothetical protein